MSHRMHVNPVGERPWNWDRHGFLVSLTHFDDRSTKISFAIEYAIGTASIVVRNPSFCPVELSYMQKDKLSAYRQFADRLPTPGYCTINVHARAHTHTHPHTICWQGRPKKVLTEVITEVKIHVIL